MAAAIISFFIVWTVCNQFVALMLGHDDSEDPDSPPEPWYEEDGTPFFGDHPNVTRPEFYQPGPPHYPPHYEPVPQWDYFTSFFHYHSTKRRAYNSGLQQGAMVCLLVMLLVLIGVVLEDYRDGSTAGRRGRELDPVVAGR